MTLDPSLQTDARGSVVERRTLDRNVAECESIDSWLKFTLGLKSATGARELISTFNFFLLKRRRVSLNLPPRSSHARESHHHHHYHHHHHHTK